MRRVPAAVSNAFHETAPIGVALLFLAVGLVVGACGPQSTTSTGGNDHAADRIACAQAESALMRYVPGQDPSDIAVVLAGAADVAQDPDVITALGTVAAELANEPLNQQEVQEINLACAKYLPTPTPTPSMKVTH